MSSSFKDRLITTGSDVINYTTLVHVIVQRSAPSDIVFLSSVLAVEEKNDDNDDDLN